MALRLQQMIFLIYPLGTYTLVVWDENYNDNQDCTDSVTVEITEANLY